MRIYEYGKCGTCRKALSFLDKHKVTYQRTAIVEHPPSEKELKFMLERLKSRGGSLKNLFNTSGEQYRELKMAEKLKNGLTEKEALQLLSKNGKLIKRPFLISNTVGLVGFKEEEWKKELL